MRLWFAMIKISRKTYNTISRIYRFGGFAIILGLLLGFSWLVGKPIEFLCVFLPYFATKGLYARQFHARSLKECFALSLIVFGFATIYSRHLGLHGKARRCLLDNRIISTRTVGKGCPNFFSKKKKKSKKNIKKRLTNETYVI